MEKDKRPLYTGRIILSFILATFLFLSGFWVSELISYKISQETQFEQENLQYEFFNLKLKREILSDTCNLTEYGSFFNQLEEMGKYMDTLEKRLGKNDKMVLEQKKVYSMLLVQHFLFTKERNEKCGDSFPTILFFYSNRPGYIDESYSLGRILTSLKNQNGDIMIYSLDYDLDSDLIDILKQKYNISEPNTLIIEEKTKLEDIENIKEIEQEIKTI